MQSLKPIFFNIGVTMRLTLFLSITVMSIFLICSGCSNSVSSAEDANTSWVFVANEGNYGSSNGSISMIDDFGNVTTVENVGDVVQSVEVYNNKLIVIVNNSHKINIYDISEEGISLPGIEIPTDNSSPREMVVLNDKIYFTNWNSQDVKVLNLFTYAIESSIEIDGLPEDIITDGTSLWVSVPSLELFDANDGTKVVKIDIDSEQIVETIEVGRGPQSLLFYESEIFVSRTYYDENWNPQHGASKIGSTGIINNNYGSGAPCGGSIMSHANTVFRSQNWIPTNEEGIVPLDNNLDFITLEKIGDFQAPLMIYHMENINEKIYFTLTDYININLLKVLDSINNEIATYDVGINPGDLAYWSKIE